MRSNDPRCPDCGEPVGATAARCLHCEEAPDPPARSGPQGRTGRQVTSASDDTVRGVLDLEPGGAVDSALTLVIGLVVGAVAGVGIPFLLALLTTEGTALLLALPAWPAATVYLATRDRTEEAFRLGCYAVAVTLALVPFVSFSPNAKGGTLVGRFVLFAVSGVLVGAVALAIAGIGYRVGRAD